MKLYDIASVTYNKVLLHKVNLNIVEAMKLLGTIDELQYNSSKFTMRVHEAGTSSRQKNTEYFSLERIRHVIQTDYNAMKEAIDTIFAKSMYYLDHPSIQDSEWQTLASIGAVIEQKEKIMPLADLVTCSCPKEHLLTLRQEKHTRLWHGYEGAQTVKYMSVLYNLLYPSSQVEEVQEVVKPNSTETRYTLELFLNGNFVSILNSTDTGFLFKKLVEFWGTQMYGKNAILTPYNGANTTPDEAVIGLHACYYYLENVAPPSVVTSVLEQDECDEEPVLEPTPLPEVVPEVLDNVSVLDDNILIEYFIKRELDETTAAFAAGDMVAVRSKIAQMHKILQEKWA